jgi:hypothetical protein
MAFLSLEKPSTILNIDTLLLRATTTSPWRLLVRIVHLMIEHACDISRSVHVSVPDGAACFTEPDRE